MLSTRCRNTSQKVDFPGNWGLYSQACTLRKHSRNIFLKPALRSYKLAHMCADNNTNSQAWRSIYSYLCTPPFSLFTVQACANNSCRRLHSDSSRCRGLRAVSACKPCRVLKSISILQEPHTLMRSMSQQNTIVATPSNLKNTELHVLDHLILRPPVPSIR